MRGWTASKGAPASGDDLSTYPLPNSTTEAPTPYHHNATMLYKVQQCMHMFHTTLVTHSQPTHLLVLTSCELHRCRWCACWLLRQLIGLRLPCCYRICFLSSNSEILITQSSLFTIRSCYSETHWSINQSDYKSLSILIITISFFSQVLRLQSSNPSLVLTHPFFIISSTASRIFR